MKTIEGYEHRVAAHCESGSLRNLLSYAGLEMSEAMIFGLGSGPAFFYLFFVKGPSTFPLVGIRNSPSKILLNIEKRCGVEMFHHQYKSTEEALREANILLDVGRPVAVSVDMYYMKYLPFFMQVHAPFHFIVLVGRDEDSYLVSDPYSAELGRLDVETLKTAWSPNANFSKDNFLAHVLRVPESIDWKRAAIAAMQETCKTMLLPPGVNRVFFFVGVQGMRTYARALAQWGKKYKGVKLREGILFNAVGFEDQGTGGGAFRIMYGAFLQELATMLGSSELQELGDRMAAHGQSWRKFSRQIVEVGKKVPKAEAAFPDWYAENATWMHEGLAAASKVFLEKADFEEAFFKDLQAAVKRLES